MDGTYEGESIIIRNVHFVFIKTIPSNSNTHLATLSEKDLTAALLTSDYGSCMILEHDHKTDDV